MDIAEVNDQPDQDILKNKDKGAFYKHAAEYWSQIPPTVDGMLGGYGFISTVDINGSSQFLKQLFRLKVSPGKGRALDCGAGIGRITKNLLLNHFDKVDLVEQNPAFVAQASASLETHPKMGKFFCSGLQDFTPEPAAYDVIWCQWVLGHLTDEDLLAFFRGCIQGIKENGVIIIKENTTTSSQLEVDSTDSSVTRPLDHLCQLLQQAGLRCVKQKRQENFPHGLYPVYMIATRPTNRTIAQKGNSADESDVAISQQIVQPTSTTTMLPPEMVPSAGTAKVEVPKTNSNDNSEQTEEAKKNYLDEPVDASLDKVGLSEIDMRIENKDITVVEAYEEEDMTFTCHVEYSSDDSTKTEVSHSDALRTGKSVSKLISGESLDSNMTGAVSNESTEPKCDIF